MDFGHRAESRTGFWVGLPTPPPRIGKVLHYFQFGLREYTRLDWQQFSLLAHHKDFALIQKMVQ